MYSVGLIYIMNKLQKISLFLLRISIGWLMFYAGITKVLDSSWSAEGYLKTAKTFAGIYHWFLTPSILPIINFINEWGLTLIGISLIFGVMVRLSSIFGVLLMLLYYFPALTFPIIAPHSFIVDEHIVYLFTFFVLAAFRAGRVNGLEIWCSNLPICSRFPKLRSWLG